MTLFNIINNICAYNIISVYISCMLLTIFISCLVFVHNLGNKLQSRYGNKNSPVTKEHIPHIFSNLDNHSSSSPLIMPKRKADYDPHLMSASKRSVYIS